MIITASTVKDTLPNVQRFVSGNLAGGVDHLVVFLDAGDPEVREWLDAHPHVTCVRTDASWWNGERPAELNVRQRTNANVVKALLSTVDWADWVFHVDADEIVQVDREVLAGVPDDVRAVQLTPLEAVSRKHWDGDPTWFKRLLGKDDLVLLHTLGSIREPRNGDYFHGHVDGKSGVRPCLDLWLTLHRVVDEHRKEQEAFRHPALRVLHYESYSGEDFVRKWTAILEAGPMASLRPVREGTALALRALIKKDLTPEQAEPYLMRIFERTTEDDFDTLRELGLLVEVDPRDGTHEPQALTDRQRADLDRLLAAIAPVRKEVFHPLHPVDEVRAALVEARLLEPVGGEAERVRGVRSLLRRS